MATLGKEHYSLQGGGGGGGGRGGGGAGGSTCHVFELFRVCLSWIGKEMRREKERKEGREGNVCMNN